MNGRYSDEIQEGTGYKEKDKYEPPVIDETGQAGRLFNEAMKDIRRIKEQRFREM